MARKINMAGERYGSLVVIKPTGETKNTHREWLCRCDCGEYKKATRGILKKGHLIRCDTCRANKAHGGMGTSLYSRWGNIKGRCNNPNNKDYANYGGRGISLDNRWQSNFPLFRSYMLSLPNALAKGYTIDRVNNNIGYEPMNLRWATVSQQNRNKRSNK